MRFCLITIYLLLPARSGPCWGTAGSGTWRSQSPDPYSLLSAPNSANFRICFFQFIPAPVTGRIRTLWECVCASGSVSSSRSSHGTAFREGLGAHASQPGARGMYHHPALWRPLPTAGMARIFSRQPSPPIRCLDKIKLGSRSRQGPAPLRFQTKLCPVG